jgi:hypothetical protein
MAERRDNSPNLIRERIGRARVRKAAFSLPVFLDTSEDKDKVDERERLSTDPHIPVACVLMARASPHRRRAPHP